MFVRNEWYVGAWSHEVRGKTLLSFEDWKNRAELYMGRLYHCGLDAVCNNERLLRAFDCSHDPAERVQ